MKTIRKMQTAAGATLALLLALAGLAADGCLAADAPVRILSAEAPQAVALTVGKSVVLRSDRDIRRVSLASPEQADILLISPRQIFLTGKAPGSTNLTLWGQSDAIMAVYDLEVAPDVTQLKRLLNSVLPNERGVKVIASGKSVTLSGSVSSATSLSSVLSLAESFAPGRIVNLMGVGGVQQVLLEVRVAEMSRNALQRFGINFSVISGGNAFYYIMNGLTSYAGGALTPSTSVNMIGSFASGGTPINAFIDALKQNGLVKVLAEPNLICLSGKTANFLAGGEIPIPIPQGLGTVAIEYKPFGVGLTFTPTVLDSGRISIQVQPEVSELDSSIGVNINNWSIPGITSRRASTTVELGNGQTFAIAGLIKDYTRETINKFPGLGDIPILGSLFRSSEFRKNETELLILVTPHLVKPLDMAKQTLPTDALRDPSSYEFFILGELEGRGPAAKKPAAGQQGTAPEGRGFDGRFGHALPGVE